MLEARGFKERKAAARAVVYFLLQNQKLRRLWSGQCCLILSRNSERTRWGVRYCLFHCGKEGVVIGASVDHGGELNNVLPIDFSGIRGEPSRHWRPFFQPTGLQVHAKGRR